MSSYEKEKTVKNVDIEMISSETRMDKNIRYENNTCDTEYSRNNIKKLSHYTHQ